MHYPLKLATVFVLLTLFFSCRKETFTTDSAARLWTGIDTLRFDTVFTNTGSATKGFKIFNRGEAGIKVQSIRLAGGAASAFRINVNGVPGPQAGGLELRSGDSAYVFVSVHVDANGANQPFVVQDSVEILYNGNREKVHLQAYGQNAHYLKNVEITGSQVWTNDKPYVITGGLRVLPGAQLTIEKGCRIYVHAGAPFMVDGTLKVEGEKGEEDNVVFAADRLDAPYRHHPGGWPGIQFGRSSQGNSISFAQLKNAQQALTLHEPAHSNMPVLTLQQTIIDNAADAGIWAIGSSIEAQNVVISNCGKNIVVAKGGSYHFTHCTIAAYTTPFVQHKAPLVQLSNFWEKDGTTATKGLQILFQNSILWGESGGLVPAEVVLLKAGNVPFSATFDHVLWNGTPTGATVLGNNLVENPQFRSTDSKLYDFRLGETSPALNKGRATVVTLDADGNARPVGLPDLGAYEGQ